jgi:hypothetical protein
VAEKIIEKHRDLASSFNGGKLRLEERDQCQVADRRAKAFACQSNKHKGAGGGVPNPAHDSPPVCWVAREKKREEKREAERRE